MRNLALSCLSLVIVAILLKLPANAMELTKIEVFISFIVAAGVLRGIISMIEVNDADVAVPDGLLSILIGFVCGVACVLIMAIGNITVREDVFGIIISSVIMAATVFSFIGCSDTKDGLRRGWLPAIAVVTLLGASPVIMLLPSGVTYAIAAVAATVLLAVAVASHKRPKLFEYKYDWLGED
jgi:hypothetical protein